MSTLNSPAKSGKGKQPALVKAQWDESNTQIFVNLCVDEIIVGRNKPRQHLNKKGWENIIAGFKNLTGVEYTKTQLKNRWDRLRQEWGWWKDLVRNESGLGRNVETGTIEASDEWWKQKLECYPKSIKFRYKPLALEDQLDILFNVKAANGEWQYTTSSGKLPTDDEFVVSYNPVIEHEATEDSENVVIVDPKELSKKRLPVSTSTGSRKLNGAARLSRSLDKIVVAVSSIGATRTDKGFRIPNIEECMRLVRAIPEMCADKESCVWAIRVFKDPKQCNSFMMLEDEEERLIWLKLEIQLEKAKFEKAISGALGSSPHFK